ncbi:MAG TPA: hypothetical protein VGO91_01215 [Pyrinomonadaceae bacterium]|jgi:hypothetical protein|nr:hypothetical protein [Pyrinomonadaceae bacterium]
MKSISRKLFWAALLLVNVVGLAFAHSRSSSSNSKTCGKSLPARMMSSIAEAVNMKEQAEMSETIKKSFPVRPGGSLTVRSSIGTVEVQAIDTNTVNIELIRKIRTANSREADEIIKNLHLDFVQNGNDVNIIASLPEEWDWERLKHLRLDFNISIPRSYNLNVRTVGIIKTSDLEGTVKLSTSGFSLTTGNVNGSVNLSSAGGPIQVGDVNGPVMVSSAGGSIRTGNINGELDAQSGGGSIAAGRVDGRVTVHSSGGSIRIEEVTNTIEAASLGGSVQTYISRQPQSDSSLVSSGGNVNLRLAENVGATIDADAGPGTVLSDYPLTRLHETHGSAYTGDINGGGPKITIRTAAGNVTLRK